MKKLFLSLTTSLFLIALFSCRKDFSTIPSPGNLRFSTDTVFLDTVFSNISTSTYALKVYNDGSKDISIPSIRLGRDNSFYRLNVDGTPGNTFTDVLLRAKDSLYILIEGTLNFSSENPLYTDSIVFDEGDKLDDVKLVTLVKDAHFIYVNNTLDTDSITPYYLAEPTPRRIHYLSDEEIAIFNDASNEKSIVIYGYCGLPENKTLQISAKKNIHFHKNSALVIEKDATLNITGTLDQKVLIEGDRLEPEFAQVAGQWDAIWLRKGSKNNSINHLDIKNGRFGIVCDSINEGTSTPTLTLKNTEIYNFSNSPILANKTSITAENIVLGNGRNSSFTAVNGGVFEFNHCTFANFWFESFRRGSTLQLSNTNTNEAIENTSNPLNATFTNCILDGNSFNELFLDKNENDTYDFLFDHCMIKHEENSTDPLYDFDNTAHYINPLLNAKAAYLNTNLNQFVIGKESELINKASPTHAAKTPLDILEVDRTQMPDIGAYQHIEFPEEESQN